MRQAADLPGILELGLIHWSRSFYCTEPMRITFWEYWVAAFTLPFNTKVFKERNISIHIEMMWEKRQRGCLEYSRCLFLAQLYSWHWGYFLSLVINSFRLLKLDQNFSYYLQSKSPNKYNSQSMSPFLQLLKNLILMDGLHFLVKIIGVNGNLGNTLIK